MSLSTCITQASFFSSLDQYEPHLPGNPFQTWCPTPLLARLRRRSSAACSLVCAGNRCVRPRFGRLHESA
jgi:hypothetical protein